MRITLAHDSFTQMGGAERVAGALHEMFPDSVVHTTVVDKRLKSRLQGWKFSATALQWLYNLYPRFQHLFPFIPLGLSLHRPIDSDVLLSSSSSFAKGFKKGHETIHINYCHTPTRFLWVDPQHADNEITPVLRPLAHIFLRWLKGWDYEVAQKVDYFIANSLEVQTRIKQYYGKDSEIVYPFVDTEFLKPTRAKQDYFLAGGRLQRAKNLDTVIKVFNTLHLPLHVVGSGRYENYLRSIAGPTIKFLGRVDDDVLRDEYSGAQALVYPQLEDFGLMPIEAAACGTPTIGLAAGGSLETVLPGMTGELLHHMNEISLEETLKQWQSNKYDPAMLRQHAEKFSKAIFQEKIKEILRQRVPLT